MNKINNLNSNLVIVEKGEDKYLAIACASIIARYYYLIWLKEKSRKYDFGFNAKKF